jgi:hypothetical protein
MVELGSRTIHWYKSFDFSLEEIDAIIQIIFNKLSIAFMFVIAVFFPDEQNVFWWTIFY